MIISKRIGYGLRILYELAANPQGFHSARTFAEVYKTEEAFLRRLLMDLRRMGWVEAQKGRTGGYKLARRPEDVKLGQVIRDLEPEALELTYGQTKGRGAGIYPLNESCPTWPFWQKVEAHFLKAVDETTLADLLQAAGAGTGRGKK